MKEHRPRKETYSEYLIYGYFYIRLSIHLYVERSDREGKENIPISSYLHINISVYIVIRISIKRPSATPLYRLGSNVQAARCDQR